MNKRNNTFWKLNLILILLFSWAISSNAQCISKNTKQSKILAPIVRILSSLIIEDQSESPGLAIGIEKKNTYLNSSLFFFSENLQVCKDILAGMADDKNISLDSSLDQNKTENDSVLVKKRAIKIEKKQSKSIWNHPGNNNTGI